MKSQTKIVCDKCGREEIDEMPADTKATPREAIVEGTDDIGRFADLTVSGVVQRFRWVDPGKFKMGSPSTEIGRWEDEGPQHAVEITTGYWMADSPVTQALYEAVTKQNPSRFKGADRPVEMVSHNDALAFVALLNKLVPSLDARLPTEAEWENACRACTTAATWAGDLDDAYRATVLEPIAVYYGNSPDGTQPVKSKRPNPFGLYDMLGNVWEWTADWFAPYSTAAAVDPRGPDAGSRRVFRGGSWYSLARGVRAAYRYAFGPGYRRGALGFRLAV